MTNLSKAVSCLACASLLFVPGRGDGQVKTRRLADGTTMIYNESPVERSRRTADRLLPVPDVQVASLIQEHAVRVGLDPRLVQAVVQVESGYNARALSRRGAMGLMQLMPDTARLLQVGDPWDQAENIRGGTSYLRRVLDGVDGRLDLALAAYNAGPTTVERYGGIPPYPETRQYVRRVLAVYQSAGGAVTGVSPAALAEPAAVATREIYVRRDADNGILITTGRAN